MAKANKTARINSFPGPVNDTVEIDLGHDLKWLYHSKPLMSATAGFTNLDPCREESIRSDDQFIYSKLKANYPVPPAYRLGKHFEDVVEASFNTASGVSLLTRNLIIKKQGVTLGELDFIYENCNGETVHLEVAIKFYLFRLPYKSLEDFVGPGGRDLLAIKWRKLTQQQLQLSLTPEVAQELAARNIKQPSRRELLLTGMLFYPYQCWQAAMPLHLGLHPQHQRGWWLSHHQIYLLQADGDKHLQEIRYLIVPRWHWLGGLSHYRQSAPILFAQLAAKVLANIRPNMVIVVSRSKPTEHWQEVSRGFIVPGDMAH